MHRLLSLSVVAFMISLFHSLTLAVLASDLALDCNLRGYPACICSSCIDPLLPQFCPDWVIGDTCPCKSIPYQSSITACVLANCTAAEGESAWAIGSSDCAAYGVTVSPVPPVLPSSTNIVVTTAKGKSTVTVAPGAATVTADTSGESSTGNAGNTASSSKGLSTGAIAGIVVGVVGGIAIGAAITYLILRRHRAQPAQQAPPPAPPQPQPPVGPVFNDKPYGVVPYPHSGQELHSESTPYPPKGPGQPQVILPIPELHSPDHNHTPPPSAPNAQFQGYGAAPTPLYEMPNP